MSNNTNPFTNSKDEDPEFSTHVNVPKLDENKFKVPHSNKKISVDLKNLSFDAPEDNCESPKFNVNDINQESPRFSAPIENMYIPEGGINFKATVNKQNELKDYNKKMSSTGNVFNLLSSNSKKPDNEDYNNNNFEDYNNNFNDYNASFKANTSDLTKDLSNSNTNNNIDVINSNSIITVSNNTNTPINTEKYKNSYTVKENDKVIEISSNTNKTNTNKSKDKKKEKEVEEVEYGRRSHLEYMKIIRDNKDPIGVHASGGLKPYTLTEVAKHNKENDLWMAVNGSVFNLTLYLDYHPGGAKKLMKGAGKDATALFNKYHPWVNYHNLVGKLQIGYLVSE